eukprot:CAMPEP_0172557420 /NCGR_PEP_ID=MMETSP1067-20121228/73136_1 /TAXON_ID=265564 ORGANISM="Thalassiosira punctigera, Strain Tpunct2005C2" /NCGR_SAMPLE_ID=MMETSP1067 /ASSEMBLY_ACC=CAM_ASM_000444 /LENGTH=39 /DNA_ID= /DNA_START= /DNA_END= /DNA_ORIENTATION=
MAFLPPSPTSRMAISTSSLLSLGELARDSSSQRTQMSLL